MTKPNDISIKGLDTFSRQFLLQSTPPGEQEYISVAPGQKASPEAVRRYEEERMRDFIHRAGSFTEDLVAFVVEQKQLRGLSNIETVFAVALATINLRNNYGSEHEDKSPEASLEEFDDVCGGAQAFFDANA